MNPYIYAHYDGDECVYIGKGTNERAWTSKHREPSHKKWMEERSPEIDVHIIASKVITTKEALALEYQLIKEMNPKFNRFGTIKKSKKEIQEMKDSYAITKSYVQTAKDLGLSKSTTWNYINGKNILH